MAGWAVTPSVNRMSRMATVTPRFALECGEQVIRFLLSSAKLKMRYGPSLDYPAEFCEALPQIRTQNLLEAYSDASFAQSDARSQTGVMVLWWLTSQQPFVALSTAEAEVVSCTEGVALSQTLKPLLEELSGQEACWCLLNDSIACSSILSYPAGSWRTRHLRLRSKAIHEMISEELLTVHHIAHKFMLADLLTKPMPPAKVWELLGFTGFDLSQVDIGKKGKRDVNTTLHLVGPLILSHLGVDEPEMLQLRELSSGWRLPAASAYATLRPHELPELYGESSEDTDSGFLPSSHSSSISIDLPWAPIEDLVASSPMFCRGEVENAFEIWLMSQRPWSEDLREFPFLDALFDLELVIFRALVEWYYDRTPTSRRSQSPRPQEDQDRMMAILNDLVEIRAIVADNRGLAWSAPSPFGRSETDAVAASEQWEHRPPSRDTRVDRRMEARPSSPQKNGC